LNDDDDDDDDDIININVPDGDDDGDREDKENNTEQIKIIKQILPVSLPIQSKFSTHIENQSDDDNNNSDVESDVKILGEEDEEEILELQKIKNSLNVNQELEEINLKGGGSKKTRTKTEDLDFESMIELDMIDENTEELPISFYGTAKLVLKQYSEIFCLKNNIDWVWIRPCFVYGPKDVSTRLIPSLISKCLKNEDIILDECKTIIDIIHIKDFIELTYNLIINNNVGVYNISSGIVYPLKEIINNIYELYFVITIKDNNTPIMIKFFVLTSKKDLIVK
jgi:hypothetical protein